MNPKNILTIVLLSSVAYASTPTGNVAETQKDKTVAAKRSLWSFPVAKTIKSTYDKIKNSRQARLDSIEARVKDLPTHEIFFTSFELFDKPQDEWDDSSKSGAFEKIHEHNLRLYRNKVPIDTLQFSRQYFQWLYHLARTRRLGDLSDFNCLHQMKIMIIKSMNMARDNYASFYKQFKQKRFINDELYKAIKKGFYDGKEELAAARERYLFNRQKMLELYAKGNDESKNLKAYEFILAHLLKTFPKLANDLELQKFVESYQDSEDVSE